MTFQRMAMNDEETVALTAGGHTFGKCHGAGDASKVGAEPEGADIAQQGLGWQSGHGSGMGDDTITSGLEGLGRRRRANGHDNYFHMLLDYEYELVTSPAGAKQWQPVNQKPEDLAPAAHTPGKKVPTMMTTADMAFEMDPEFRKISEKFRADPRGVRRCFRPRLVQADPPRHGAEGPLPRPGSAAGGSHLAGPGARRARLASEAEVAEPQGEDSGERPHGIAELVKTAWASASTYRGSDHRGGANGARIRLSSAAGTGRSTSRRS